MMVKTIQYVMLDANGELVTKSHQDDEETIISSDTIEDLFEQVSERAFDYCHPADFFEEEFKEGGACEGWSIAKQEITTTLVEDWRELVKSSFD